MIRVPIHFVWTTHERMPLIPEQSQRLVWRFIEAICRDVRCDVLAVGGMPEHIHLLVNFTNTLSLGEFMKRVKGGSSHYISTQLRRGEFFAWQSHYGAFSVSIEEIARVVAYITHQHQHHTNGSVQPRWEVAYAETEVD